MKEKAVEVEVGAVRHSDVDAEGVAVVLRVAALAGKGAEYPSVGMLESMGVPDLNGPALEAEGEECHTVGILQRRGVPNLNGPALEAEGEECHWVEHQEGREEWEQRGLALEAEGEGCPLVGHQVGKEVWELGGLALEAEGEGCPLVGHQEGREVWELGGLALEAEGEGCPLVGHQVGKEVWELGGLALEAEGEGCPLVGHQEGREVWELGGQALEAEGERCPLVGHQVGREVWELGGLALEAEGERCPLVGHQVGREVWELGGLALEAEGERCPLVGHQVGREVWELGGLALEAEGERCPLVGHQVGREVWELGGLALEAEGERCPLVGHQEGREVWEQRGLALEAEGERCPLVGMLEGREVWELGVLVLEAEGEGCPLVGHQEGREVWELGVLVLEAEGEGCPLVGHQEGREVWEQRGLALEAEGERCPLVPHQEGREVWELGGSVLGVGMEASRCSGLEQETVSMLRVVRWLGLDPVSELQASFGHGSRPASSGEDVRRATVFGSQESAPSTGTGFGGTALTTVGTPCAPAFDVNSVLRRAREWYRAEDIDTGRNTPTHGVPEGQYAEQFHPASALALPWPDCGQRANGPAQGVDEPAFEEDPVPEDAQEDGDVPNDGDGEPGIHVRTGFYRNRRGSSYRIGGIMLLHWARLFAVTLRFGIYTSNATESINSAVRSIRMLPPTWLLASLWDWFRDKWYARQENARQRDEYLTVAAAKRLDQKRLRCQGYWFIGGNNTVGTIQTRGGENETQWRSFNVNLDGRTCDCGNWEEYQFPCAHAVAMCILKKRSVELFVSEYYTTRNLRQTYNRHVLGTCVDRLVMEAPRATEGDCDAPALIETRLGRSENHTRFEAPPHAYRCGRCRQHGHNRKRCKFKYGGYGQAQAEEAPAGEDDDEDEAAASQAAAP
ncbi:unnamed protein product [Closterium sp. Naga37s-1]|nr:unnamed protein product [Closterium sp. Naga37s-1]